MGARIGKGKSRYYQERLVGKEEMLQARIRGRFLRRLGPRHTADEPASGRRTHGADDREEYNGQPRDRRAFEAVCGGAKCLHAIVAMARTGHDKAEESSKCSGYY